MFADRLKLLRENVKLSQIELGNILGVTRSAVSSYEVGRNEPSYEMLIKIARLFDVDVDYLVGYAENPNIVDRKKNYRDDITEDELGIINMYRKLNAGLQETVKTVIYGFLGNDEQLQEMEEVTVKKGGCVMWARIFAGNAALKNGC